MANKLTELENCALALIGERQPCSAYDLRQAFARAVTPDWSGSTGSIYPLVRRLLKMELIRTEPQPLSARGRRDLWLTPEGEQALETWITTLEPWMAKATYDPLRRRASYLKRFNARSVQFDFYARAQALTEERASELRDLAEAKRTVCMSDYVSTLGALYQLEARLKWLREVAALVNQDQGPSNRHPAARPS